MFIVVVLNIPSITNLDLNYSCCIEIVAILAIIEAKKKSGIKRRMSTTDIRIGTLLVPFVVVNM